MPRQPRLDIPDLVHHVIVRGIKRDRIFRDDDDRRDFLRGLHNLLTETETTCYAWALIPNHFHLLLRPCGTSLSSFMRRLLTGYAVTFNKRHHRSGHMFQNRYKSIVCEEEVYHLELIRYIHLNPLRAGLVQDMAMLDAYPWCGHAEVMTNRSSGGWMSRAYWLFSVPGKNRNYASIVGLSRMVWTWENVRNLRAVVCGAGGCFARWTTTSQILISAFSVAVHLSRHSGDAGFWTTPQRHPFH